MDKILDVRGLNCPGPALMIINTLRKMDKGEILKVIVNDEITKKVIPSLCSRLGYRLVGLKEGEGIFQYFIQK